MEVTKIKNKNKINLVGVVPVPFHILLLIIIL